MSEKAARIDRLLDAIEYLSEDRAEDARRVLRELIYEDNDFEDAWLWMSVAVDSLDQSSLCLDNVLRINPDNVLAAGALHRIRKGEILMQDQRLRIRFLRDFSLVIMWLLVLLLLFGMLVAYIPGA